MNETETQLFKTTRGQLASYYDDNNVQCGISQSCCKELFGWDVECGRYVNKKTRVWTHAFIQLYKL